MEKKIIQRLKIENATVKYRDQVLFSGLNLEIKFRKRALGRCGGGRFRQKRAVESFGWAICDFPRQNLSSLV
ncbi:MAG: hypothetical protein R2875_09940 [Desulfobacterales bacterium]